MKTQHAIGCGYKKTLDRNALADCAEGNPGCDNRRAAIRFCLELIIKHGPPEEREISKALLDELEHYDREQCASFTEAAGQRLLHRLSYTVEAIANKGQA